MKPQGLHGEVTDGATLPVEGGAGDSVVADAAMSADTAGIDGADGATPDAAKRDLAVMVDAPVAPDAAVMPDTAVMIDQAPPVDVVPADTSPGKLPLGSPCGAPTECVSGFCAEGVCCNTTCNANCRSCVIATRVGTCSSVAAGQVPPRGGCREQRETCGNTGLCDGAGRCEQYAPQLCAPSVLPVAPATPSPVVDGQLDEVWKAIPAHAIDNLLRGTATDAANLSAQLRALRDTDALYLLLDVQDDVLANDSIATFQDDSIEIYLDGDLSAGSQPDGINDLHFVFGIGDLTFNETLLNRTQNVSFAAMTTPGGYLVEVRIPWDVIQVPAGARQFGIDVHVNDDDPPDPNRDRKLGWFMSEMMDNFLIPQLWGKATLAESTP